jgi:hypothetical protein
VREQREDEAKERGIGGRERDQATISTVHRSKTKEKKKKKTKVPIPLNERNN